MNLEVFNYRDSKVRVVNKDGTVWFVAKDACAVLELSNPTVALERLDEDERSKFNLGRQGEVNVVNEYGLYNLILGSRKPEAKNFKRWITHEVLPSIRKHGVYATDTTLDQMINNPEFGIRLLTELKVEREERRKLEHQNQINQQLIGELKPKADYTTKILQNKGLVTITQIAKDYGISGQKMNAILHELGVQYKQSDQWLLYREYHDKGYTHSSTVEITRKDGRLDVVMNTKWTQKGRLFLYNLLKDKKGILPVIEQNEAV